MHRQRFGTDPPPLDLGDAAALATASLDEVAAELLRELDADESFSRHNLFLQLAGSQPRPAREHHLQLLAEAWQRLEHAGFVCEAALGGRDDGFVTRLGRGKQRSSDLVGELQLARRA